MASMRKSCSGEMVLIPPQLPSYLSDISSLKSIVGRPSDESIKAIHAVIRSLDAVAHLPAFYNPDLSVQLSQHLFTAQMATYRANYSTSLLPGEKSIYRPPTLPSHVTGTLEQVVGVPSDDEIKSVQSALRSVDGLAIYPQLFDEDLSMRLSQHLFNIQFARYMHDSSEGQFVSEAELGQSRPEEPNPTQGAAPTPEAEKTPHALSELIQLGETMKEVKDVLENMNRVLTLIKRDQSTVGCVEKYYQVYKNPLNQSGMAASECGLPQLRYEYLDNGYRYKLWMEPGQIARYLKFFSIGTDLIRDGANPELIDGKRAEAEKLLLAQVGVPLSQL